MHDQRLVALELADPTSRGRPRAACLRAPRPRDHDPPATTPPPRSAGLLARRDSGAGARRKPWRRRRHHGRTSALGLSREGSHSTVVLKTACVAGAAMFLGPVLVAPHITAAEVVAAGSQSRSEIRWLRQARVKLTVT